MPLYDFHCDAPQCGFRSLSHLTEEARDARGAQHKTEHETGQAMPELVDFMKEQDK